MPNGVVTMKRTKIGMLGLVVASAIVATTAVAAHAEGSRNTYLSGWSPGAASSTWADSNGDSLATRVALFSVNAFIPYTSTTRTPSSVQLELQRDQWGIGWVNQGNRTAAPGYWHSWGDNNWSGTFRFRLNGWTANGQWYGSGSGWQLNAGTVWIRW